MKKSFSFKGLTRNSDNLLVADGECMELLNMSVRDGCMYPVSSNFNETELEDAYSKLFWHAAAGMLICLLADGSGRVHIYDKEYNIVRGEDGGLELFPNMRGVTSVEFLDNVVCCITNCTTYYFIYKKGKYLWLGEKPQMPDLLITYKSVVESLTSEEEYLWGVVTESDNPSNWNNASKGYFDECLSLLHNKGYYVDRALFRCALRLYDGSHICYSPIYYVDDDSVITEIARDEGNFVSKGTTTNQGTLCKYKVSILGFLPEFVFSNINLDAWENIVVGIDVFSTGSIYGHKVVSGNEVDSSGNAADRYIEKDARELVNDVLSASMFYRVAEYDIKGVEIDRIKNVSPSNLALSQRLGDDDSSLCCRGADCSYLFNGRLHLGGLREMFFKGYGGCSYLPSGVDEAVADFAVVTTKIKTTQGDSVVKREYDGSFVMGVKDGVYCITPFLMYPDSRAVEMTLAIRVGEDIFKKSFPLKIHANLNMALFINGYGSGVTAHIEGALSNGSKPTLYSAKNVAYFFSNIPGRYVIEYDGTKWYYGDKEFVITDGPDEAANNKMILFFHPAARDSITIVVEDGKVYEDFMPIGDILVDSSWDKINNFDEFEEVNVCEHRDNVLKVSAVDNPFIFPAKSTYVPSKEKILAVCSNTMALSQGQFGQHPLLVFCNDGIWALSSDASGALAYSTSHPISREVCMAGASLCRIDSGVVFAGQRGLMLLQGTSLGLISGALEARSHLMQHIGEGDIFCRIASAAGITLPVNDLSFRDYLNSAVVGYVAAEDELWVSAEDYSYSYVYSLSARVWSKVDRSYSCFADKSPHLIGVRIIDGKSRVSVLHRDYASSSARVLLFTRPQLWGSKLPKRIQQFILHASVKMANKDNGLLCCLLCSNDGVHFKLVDAREKVSDFNDVVFSYFPTHSYKYFVIALSGVVSVDSSIVGAELAVTTAWENRLR